MPAVLQETQKMPRIWYTTFLSTFGKTTEFWERIIDHLPPQARKIFLMNRFDRKTAVTIASELGLSPRTVEKHLEIALKNLKKELKDYLPATLLLWLSP